MGIIEDLKWRYATKQFDPKRKISKEHIEVLKDAVNLTATSYGLQMYKVLIVENQEIKDQLKAASWNQGQVSDCSQHFVFLKHKKFDATYVDKFIQDLSEVQGTDNQRAEMYKGIINQNLGGLPEEQFQTWSAKQTYIALGNLMTACANLRIDSCPMEGIDAAAYDKILGLEDSEYSTVVACPVGYRSSEDKYQFLPKYRKPNEDLFETI